MVGGETDSSLREETGVCPTMPLVRWQHGQQGKSERDRPAQRCRELALGDKLANRCRKQRASETDTRPGPLRKRGLCCRFGARVRSPCFWMAARLSWKAWL